MARTFELSTPLGTDAQGQPMLLFRAMHGREELGRLSEFEVSALSSNANIGLGDLLGENVTVKMQLQEGGFRFFNGFVTRFAQEGMVGRHFHYRMTVRPWLWFLTRTADCRIFQDKTAAEIILEVLGEHPFAVLEQGLTGAFARREYCVQYRETDFNFVSRLMEEEGIYYFFEHQDGRHVLKLVDSLSGHKALDNTPTIAFFPPGKQVRVDQEFIHAWNFAQSIQPGVVALDDYDFKRPKADLAVKAQLLESHSEADHEIFDWPGEYRGAEHGELYARARIAELHSEFDRAEAECNVREIAPGRLFTLSRGPRADQEREYLITGATWELRDNAFESSAGEPTSYHCQFSALHTRQQFRPERITPEPRISGPQTAVVTGRAEDDIFTDEFGRIKVVFHWDRDGRRRRDENTSCFLRVAQPWAGNRWGAIFLPRKGQEVLVDFLEGDPDQPIIIGSVYNADQMPPYELPANKTQSGIKTRSSPNGTPSNFNEIRFEDRKGREQLVIHAERNQQIVVEASESHSVGHDRTKTIGHDETTVVKNDRTETVGGNETIAIAKNRTIAVSENEVAGVLLTRTHAVGVNELITVGGAQEIVVGGARTVTVGGAQVTAVGLHLSQNVAKNMSVEAGDEISIKTGAASILMKKDGTIKIEGKEITISATDKIKITAQSALEMDGGTFSLKAPIGQGTVNAATILDVKGATVKINC